jgi:hypothetical protein
VDGSIHAVSLRQPGRGLCHGSVRDDRPPAAHRPDPNTRWPLS